MNLLNEELIAKYNIIINGYERFYKIPLDHDSHNLDCTTPRELVINGNSLQETAWNRLIVKFIKYIYSLKPDVNYLKFVPSWKTYYPFEKKERTAYHTKIDDNLYYYHNLSSDHSYKFIVELLKYCDIDLSNNYIIVHRSPFAEPKEVKEYVTSKVKLMFKQFLIEKHNYSDKNSDIVINNIDTVMNSKLSDVSQSYNNFFMFTNMQCFINVTIKFLEYLPAKTTFKQKAIDLMTKYVGLLKEFYHLLFSNELD